MENDLQDLEENYGHKISGISAATTALVVWAVVASIALIVIGVLTYKRWRSGYNVDSASSIANSSELDTESGISGSGSIEPGQDNSAYNDDELNSVNIADVIESMSGPSTTACAEDITVGDGTRS